jgi:Ca-activated chloride channel family protein
MEIRIGERRIIAEIQEKEQAKRTYELAKESGRKAALVDQRRPNLFTTAVANINPEETISVVLEYFEEARYLDGLFSLRFPLTFTPRFTPRLSTEEPPPEIAAPFVRSFLPDAPRAQVTLRLRPGTPLREIVSDSHDIELHESDGAWDLRTTEERIVADRDFLVSWEPLLDEDPRAAVFVEEREGWAYATIMVMPPVPRSSAGLGLPTETLFIIDVSGSMDGPSIKQARQALLAALGRLRSEDRFNMLKFNDVSEPFQQEFQQATPEALEGARSWVRNLHASGGTMIHPALLNGLRMMGESRSSHVQRIVFLTDGAVANEDEVLTAIVERLGETRLHVIGIGHAPNGYLMRKMASFGRGLCEFISTSGHVDNRISSFFARLDRPVMTDVQLQWTGIDPGEPYPSRPPDLHAGEPLIISTRLDGLPLEGRLVLGGYTREGWVESEVEIDDRSARGAGIALRWARAKVGSLMDSLHEGADPGAVRREVVDLGLQFNLVTPYTSLVAVEERPSAIGPSRRVRMANALPSGGTDNALRATLGWLLAGAGLLLLLVMKGRAT